MGEDSRSGDRKTAKVRTGKVRVSSKEHRERLAAALRANLRRRKRQDQMTDDRGRMTRGNESGK